MAWELTDLAYHAIVSTNNHRGFSITDKNQFLFLYSAEQNFRQTQESIFLETISGTPNFFSYLWGFFGEQRKFQSFGCVLDNVARELYIMLDIAPRLGIDYIEGAIKDSTGVSWQVLQGSLFMLWTATEKGSIINDVADSIIEDEEFTKEQFGKVLSLYTTDCKEVRESKIKRQILYTKPFIKVGNEVLSINRFLNLFAYEHAAYWAVRNKYSNSQTFMNDFGSMFEAYFRELLETYVAPDSFIKIEESNKRKRADWKLRLGNWKLLIEQKCPLVKLSAKQQEVDVDAVNDFCNKQIIKAIKQLHMTESDFGDGPYVKVILLYEDYLYESILDNVFQLPTCDVVNDKRYVLITIDSMEKLLALYKDAPERACELLRKVVEEKCGLEQLLYQEGIRTNEYTNSCRIKKYSDSIVDFLCRHLNH